MWGPQRTEKQSGVLTPWVSIPVQRGSSGKEKRKRKRKWKKKLKKEKRGRGGERRDACVESRSQSYPKRIIEEDPTLRRVATPSNQTSTAEWSMRLSLTGPRYQSPWSRHPPEEPVEAGSQKTLCITSGRLRAALPNGWNNRPPLSPRGQMPPEGQIWVLR